MEINLAELKNALESESDQSTRNIANSLELGKMVWIAILKSLV